MERCTGYIFHAVIRARQHKTAILQCFAFIIIFSNYLLFLTKIACKNAGRQTACGVPKVSNEGNIATLARHKRIIEQYLWSLERRDMS